MYYIVEEGTPAADACAKSIVTVIQRSGQTQDEVRELADRIIAAVNSHAALVAALKDCIDFVAMASTAQFREQAITTTLAAARAALAMADPIDHNKTTVFLG